MTENAENPPQIDDRDLIRAVHSFHRLRWYVIGSMVTLVTLAVVALAATAFYQHSQLLTLRQQLTGGCRFFADLAGAPLEPVPPAKRPSQLGVTLVVDSRSAAESLSCPNMGAVPDSLKKWAAYYHIPVH